ncbi:hypothetical protein EDB80DRAFT_739514 [Ilyonectria destructans]|nr:hypothetical protein EDB80DRAFT_739514 [Ilyonectria destructans]
MVWFDLHTIPYQTIPITAFGSIPTQNSWFIIRIRDEGKYLSVIDGKVCLHETLHPWGGFRWRCMKNDGWFGFREFVTGRYLGCDKGDVVIRALKQTGKEYFAISHQPEGGYHLSVFHEDANNVKELRQMKADRDGKLLFELKGRAALWEFCRVDGP